MGVQIVIDEQAMLEVENGLSKYSADQRYALEDAIKKLEHLREEWDDEDYEELLYALRSFMAHIEGIELGSKQLRERINKKRIAYTELCNRKI